MILMIDNYDSFTWNVVQYLWELGADVDVERNDAISLADMEARAPQGIELRGQVSAYAVRANQLVNAILKPRYIFINRRARRAVAARRIEQAAGRKAGAEPRPAGKCSREGQCRKVLSPILGNIGWILQELGVEFFHKG